MNENLVLFEESINKTLNFILEDYQKARAKCASAAAELQNYLRGMEGSQGPMLAANHPFFRGVNILQANQKFQSKKIDDVLSLIQGTDLKDDDKEDLKTFYEEFFGIYSSIVDEMLKVRYDGSNNKIPIDFSGLIGNIKNIFSSESGKRWTERDIQEQIEWGELRQKKKKIALLLAHIFALWSLMNSEHFKKQQEQDANQENLKGYLLQPHVAQILSILRMMGAGYSEIYRGGSDFNKNWANVFGTGSTDNSWIRNNLVQIKTGEGKSVVLAVVSIIFALNGFEVNCACYSKYLSTRDYESFYPLFRALGLQKVISYGTFNEIAEKKLNEDGEIRDIIQALVLKEEFSPIKPVLYLNQEKNPQLLLIDEVDVFFSNSFYGRLYIPQAQIKHEKISALTDYIWNRRQKKIEEEAKVSQDQQQKYPYLSLKELKETTEYKNALNLFKPEFQFLVEEAAKKMIIDVVEYQSPDHLYVIHQGEIGYENQDQISTNATIGYQTLYAYYYRHSKGEIKDNVFQSKKAIGINCSSFSYAEVPLEYNIILGVTGTLETLSEPQKNIINDVYKIHHQTLSPSVHSSDESRIFNPNSGVTIVKDTSEYYMKLINEMAIYLESSRPIILFFEHNKSLSQFLKSENFKDKKFPYQILNELDSDSEKRVKVLKATQAKTITLSTKNFGRGTDFCCYDQKVIEAGGLVVIQTFLSEDLSEETQIRGRTGRQGTKGTYIMFLNLSDLSKFNIELVDIENSGHYYKTLCEFRDRKLARENQETTKNRETLKIQHDLSINMMNSVKDIIMPQQFTEQELETAKEQNTEEEFKIGDRQCIDQENLNEYLLGMNKGITLETDDQFMKVLVLMDATSSMGVTLQKTKNCVSAMFQEAKNALKEMNLSEDLILMKIAGYRNYSSLEENILQVSPEWTSNPLALTEFLNGFKIQGGLGNEAIEIGLQYANKEIENNQGIPLSMVIVIGDAPPNTLLEVDDKRSYAANKYAKNKKYWEKTLSYRVSTYWEHELRKIKEEKVPVHAFYVLNEKNLHSTKAEMEKEKAHLKTEFSKLTVNEGKCAFLDIHDEKVGQQKLKDFIKYLIVYRATEINYNKEKALESVSKMEVSFT